MKRQEFAIVALAAMFGLASPGRVVGARPGGHAGRHGRTAWRRRWRRIEQWWFGGASVRRG